MTNPDLPAGRLQPPIEALPEELVSIRETRAHYLERVYASLTDGNPTNSVEADKYIWNGGSLRLLLCEYRELFGEPEPDKAIQQARETYLQYALDRPPILKDKHYDDELRQARAVYVDAVLLKIDAILDAKAAEALRLGQMPTIVHKASFEADNGVPTEEELAGNHLYLLIDTALKEHVERRRFIEFRRQGRFLSKLSRMHRLRFGISALVFMASANPKFHVIPIENEQLSEDIETSMKLLSGVFAGVEFPEVVRYSYLSRKHDKQAEKLRRHLAENRRLTELAVRMVCNETRHDGGGSNGAYTGRDASEDAQENLTVLEGLDDDFEHMNNDPGGKPYTADMAIGYATRLLIEREHQLKPFSDSSLSHEERRQHYMNLAREILEEDLKRMTKGLQQSRYRRMGQKVLAVVPALILTSATASVAEASKLSRETSSMLDASRDRHDHED